MSIYEAIEKNSHKIEKATKYFSCKASASNIV